MHVAALNSHGGSDAHVFKKIATLLVANGADLQLRNLRGATALDLCPESLRDILLEEESKHVLDQCVDRFILAVCYLLIRCSLWTAASTGSETRLQQLLAGGASVNAVNEEQRTALHLAAKV